MKKVLFIILVAFAALYANAQNESQARSVLNKTASLLGRKGGVSASFTLSNSKIGTVSGSIAVKGKKFNAKTKQAIVWYNGKTQWSYIKRNNEVNVTTPTPSQQQMMNPYAFINIYRSGYKLGLSNSGNNHIIHLKANGHKSISEMYITIGKSTNIPSIIKYKQNSSWTTIRIRNFRTSNLSDRVFTFNYKDFPSAEVVDLR